MTRKTEFTSKNLGHHFRNKNTQAIGYFVMIQEVRTIQQGLMSSEYKQATLIDSTTNFPIKITIGSWDEHDWVMMK